jgi:two-component system, OmpR family, KDP operon response regulator KdpE
MARVLVIDDDHSLLRALQVGLHTKGHEVITATTAEKGLSEAALAAPDVVVLDLGLPDADGLVVCRRLREWTAVPIIVLSATGSEDRKVAALDGGADDYMTKPFGMAELEARIRAALRHRASELAASPSPVTVVGPLEVDHVRHEARLDGRPLDLTARELELLGYLARNAGKVSTHQMILSQVWGTGYGKEAQYLHAYVHRLRLKLGDSPGISIKTNPGIGYSLTATA